MTDQRITAIIIMGVSGSGKSSVASALSELAGIPFQDGDAFHPASNVAKMSAGHPLDDTDRKPWLEAIAKAIGDYRARNERVIIACSALKHSYRDILRANEGDVVFALLDGSKELIGKRIAARANHFMPTSLLDSQFATLERPGQDERAHAFDIGKPVTDIAQDIADHFRLTQG